ncbi:serine/threonine-protein phosphatase 4 regulatory subunit 4-like isoform X2 [Cotesia glomerata]|uniref:serine/threonine-protein phosphatase 4 regulatory subunit 4-like isoform X2 n=1 Tax=Cotesia glomerata TaxID=32391 RepID=UPI001D024801|nr:serine/threonine-protein phosphatase 4 regulatory subunit 4-like isoform X2 [Cotesia glomerata]
MSNSDEDYMNLQLDRPLLDKIRTDEQIRRHTLDKRFDKIPVDRALHILLKGDEIQKLSVIQTLPSLLVGDPQTCIQRLMPKMQESLQEASTEFHVAASSTFKTILEQRLVSHSTFTQTFLQSILNSLDSKDQVVADAWLETLLDVIELLPSEVIKREILQVAISKGQLSQPVNSRIICCKLLGKICTRFNSQLIRKQVLPTVHSLCQDVNSDVRACICLQLRFVAEGLGPESVKSALLPSIVELASDEESIVRHASVQTIVYLLPHLNADVIKSTISPLIKKSCDNALKSDVTVMCTIAEEFGKLAIGLEKSLSTSEKTWLIQFFKQLSQVGILPNKDKKPSGSTFNSNNTNSNSSNPGNKQQEFSTINISTSNPTIVEHYVECRRLCAFNIPAMFIFAASTIEDVDDLIATFSELSADPFYLVRRTIACGIHEVAKILGPKNYLIRGELIKLLKDDNEQVLQGLIPELSKTLELLIQSQSVGIEQLESSVVDMGKALLKCENEIFNTNNWRLSKLMLEQLEILPKCFPSDYIYTYFVPVTLNRALNARPMPVKLAAGRTFLVFIRYNLKPVERSELRNKLYSKFARNKSCYIRMLFIRMMIEAMTLYSSMYFKEHFYMVVLSLSEDPIANIRLKLVSLLPTLKSYIRLPSDKKLLSSFESSVRNLMNNEKDRDVISALTTVIRKLDEIDVRHEGQSSSVKLNKQDNDDFKKYEEEKQIMATVSGKLSTGQQVTLIKKSPIAVTGRVNSNDGASSIRNTKQSGISSDNLSKSSISSQKVKQTGSMPLTDSTTFKSRQTTTKSFDLAKASTSSDDLTSSWARLTSNSMLLTHLWEKIDHRGSSKLSSLSAPSSSSSSMTSNQSNFLGIATNNSEETDISSNYYYHPPCNCYKSSIYPSSSLSSSGNIEMDYKSTEASTYSCRESLSSKLNSTHLYHNHHHHLYNHHHNHHHHHHHNHNHNHKSNYLDTNYSSLTTPLVLTRNKDDRHGINQYNNPYKYLNNYLMPRESTQSYNNDDNNKLMPNFAALRAVTNAAQHNSCWGFSSMPEIPVTLLEDEFLVDTGMRIPAQLSSLSQSTSKIPNLQDIIYRNTRIDNYNVNKSRRSNISSSPCSSISFNNSGVINIDNKGKSKIHYQLPESCLRRTTSVDKSNSIGNIVGNRLSMSFDETTKINKITINDDNNDNDDDDDEENIKSKKYSSKSIIGKRLSSSNRNNSTSNNSTTGESITITGTSKIIDDKKKKLLFVDRDKNFIPSNTNITNITTAATTTTTTTTAGGGGGGGGTRILDKTKRHSASYSIKFFDSKNYKDKFKRHSLEVPEYSPERGRLKRNYTLDVNHNQGISKIPLRNSILTGSRTAPVTRASSPIRLGPQISFDREKDHQTGNKYHHSDHRVMTRFSSSDEQVDKLCIRFAYVDSYGREENPRKSISKLPVWVPRKKL